MLSSEVVWPRKGQTVSRQMMLVHCCMQYNIGTGMVDRDVPRRRCQFGASPEDTRHRREPQLAASRLTALFHTRIVPRSIRITDSAPCRVCSFRAVCALGRGVITTPIVDLLRTGATSRWSRSQRPTQRDCSFTVGEQDSADRGREARGMESVTMAPGKQWREL